MPTDPTTFTLAFTAVFGGIAFYLWSLDKKMRDLSGRIGSLEGRATKAKNDDDPGSEQE